MILNGDCLEVLKQLPDDSVDQLVTDPPYGIAFMGKSWDDALPSIDIWKECYRVMKPGSFGFIMCIPRQDCLSRMMISLENAGFNINFSSIYWTYASGFPKALNMGKAIDKRLGKEREVVGYGKRNHQDKKSYGGNSETIFVNGGNNIKGLEITNAASDQAKQMEGSYGGFQPKPAVEVIIVVMKPLSAGSYINQAMKDGKGVTWLDDCRIPYKDDKDEDSIKNKAEAVNDMWYRKHTGKGKGEVYQHSTSGRFPANLLVSDDILGAGKVTSSKGGFDHYQEEGKNIYDGNVYHKSKTILIDKQGPMGDVGTYSRFFSLDAWAEKNLPFLIVPKASKSEKNEGLDDFEEKKSEIGKRLSSIEVPLCMKCGKGLAEVHIGKGKCCCENPDFKKVSVERTTKNNHPTVKPIKLMSYLITMGSRPGDVILDPFAGSGTTGCAAILLDRKIIMIEKETEYIEICKARIDYYKNIKKDQPLKI